MRAAAARRRRANRSATPAQVRARPAPASISAQSSRPLRSEADAQRAFVSPSVAADERRAASDAGRSRRSTSGLQRCASARRPSAKRTGSRTWRRQYDGAVSSAASATRAAQVGDEAQRRRAQTPAPRPRVSNASSIGSTQRRVERVRHRQRLAADAGARRSVAQRRDRRRPSPEITVCAGPLTAAIDDPRGVRRAAAAAHLRLAARTPPPSRRRPAAPASGGRARRSARSASSQRQARRPTQAATTSPTLWPITHVGRHAPATATAAASAYFEREQRRLRVARSRRAARRRRRPRTARRAAAAAGAARARRRSGRARRGTPARRRTSARAMPAYCAPWPVNRNAMRGGSRRRTCARAQQPSVVARRRGERGAGRARSSSHAAHQQRGAVREVRAAGVGGVSRRRRSCVVAQRLRALRRGGAPAPPAPRASRADSASSHGAPRRALRRRAPAHGRRLFDDDVRVGAAEAERADAGDAPAVDRRPRRRRCVGTATAGRPRRCAGSASGSAGAAGSCGAAAPAPP